MINAKRLQEMRKQWDDDMHFFSRADFEALASSLSASLKVVEAADKTYLRKASPELDEALRPFTEKKEKE